MANDMLEERRRVLLSFMAEVPRPVSSAELLRRLQDARRSRGDSQDPVYGTLASQNNALSIELSRDLVKLTADQRVRQLDDGTFAVESRALAS